MKQFDSQHSYRVFESNVKRKFRYFRDESIANFLEVVLETAKKRAQVVCKGKHLWRAQLGHGLQPLYNEETYIDDIPSPFPRKRMKPIPNEAIEGRANPKGIPYLYMATNKETAMGEVRPWLGSLISVGVFKLVKDIFLVNCCDYNVRTKLYLEEPPPKERENIVWSHIDHAFSKPILNNDKGADYVPSQIIAELFKTNGFDGVLYKSLLGDGYNIALFDLNSAELVSWTKPLRGRRARSDPVCP